MGYSPCGVTKSWTCTESSKGHIPESHLTPSIRTFVLILPFNNYNYQSYAINIYQFWLLRFTVFSANRSNYIYGVNISEQSEGNCLHMEEPFGREFWDNCWQAEHICRFSAKMSITIQIAISLEVPRGRARLPRHLVYWLKSWFLSFAHFSPKSPLGVSNGLSHAGVAAPTAGYRSLPAYHHFTCLLQANRDPYLTWGENHRGD